MVEPLPSGAVLLHIGPHKTGTTTLQGALHAKRAELETFGVHYAGRGRQARVAAAAVVGSPLPGRSEPFEDRWPKLVREVKRSHADRVVISSETFSNADDDAVARIHTDLGPATQIVITLRPLAKLLASQWQQYVQSGLTSAYGDWLADVMADPSPVKGFWRRHDHAALARRWARAFGSDHVTVVILEEGDRTMNLRIFEELLTLPSGLLEADDRTNRSFTLPEIELVRELNRQYWDAGLPRADHDRYVRFGLDYYLKERTPATTEAPIVTPLRAQRWADEKAQEIAAGLTSSGVRIVGELDWLRVPVPEEGPEETAATDRVGVETAARAVMGALDVSVIHPKSVTPTARPARSTKALTKALARSLRRDAARASRSVRRKLAR